jgi:aminopeptidase N
MFLFRRTAPAMASDDTSFTHSIVLPVGKTEFDDVSYRKSAVVLQMLSKFSGVHFWCSIISYLADNIYKPVKIGSLLIYFHKNDQDSMKS